MSESEYKKWVLADFDKKKAIGLLPNQIMSPTPGRLKAECVKLLEQDLDPKDEKLFRSFFGQKAGAASYRTAIQNSSADPFRPLTTFLRDRAVNTEFRNIELLAWLVDFEPRPYHPGLDAGSQPTRPSTRNSPAIEPVLGNKGTEESQPLRPEKMIKTEKMRFYAFLLLPLILGSAAYWFFSTLQQQPTGREGCMIWVVDRYKPVECNDRSLPGAAIPIKGQLVEHFRKITRPDTLTPYSIRKVWYAKYNGRIEFFTSDGLYPLDTTRRLLPMTDHILDKYIYHVKN
jgi:hypothetical protein